MSKKTILLTGSAGFIASHLADNLIAQGHDVVGIDNFNDYYDIKLKARNLSQYFDTKQVMELADKIKSPYRSFDNPVSEFSSTAFTDSKAAAENFVETANYRIYGLDLCDYAALKMVFQNHDFTHIVHIAAVAGVRPSVMNPVFYQKNNGDSTINLLQLAVEANIHKFVFASSSSVYGNCKSAPFKETEDISKPISPYAATKVAGEAMLHSFASLYKMPSVALRFFTVYGPRQRPDLAINKFTKLIDAGQSIEIYGDGSALRDFTYIDDIVDGVLKSIDLDCAFEIFNLGESQTTDVKTLVSLLEDKLGKKAAVNYTDPVPGDVPLTYADISKSKSVLAYNPQTKIKEGLGKFVDWYKKQN